MAERTLFDSLAEKAQWMDGAAALDALDPHVQSVARCIVAGADGAEQRAERLHKWVRDRIWYSSDPWGVERTPDARVTLEEGTEDCDGKARTLVALVRALHDPMLHARIRSVWGPDGAFFHVQAEIRIGRGPWRVAELVVRGVELGERPNLRGPLPVV